MRTRSRPPTTGRAGSIARGPRSTARRRSASPAVLEPFAAKSVFSATELERFADCSSAWLFERVIDPKRIDAEPDPMLRGQVAAHDAAPLLRDAPARARLRARDAGEPRGGDRARACAVSTPRSSPACGSISRRCRRPSCGTRCAPISRASSATRPRPTSGSSRAGSRSRSAPSAPRRSSSAASSSPTTCSSRGRSTGSTSTRSAPAGSSRTTSRGRARTRRARSTASCGCRSRCTSSRSAISSASSRSVASTARSPGAGSRAGCCARRRARISPASRRTTTSTRRRSGARSRRARERAAENAGRIRAGDVRHDPKGDGCPAWCDLWPMCRVQRA